MSLLGSDLMDPIGVSGGEEVTEEGWGESKQ